MDELENRIGDQLRQILQDVYNIDDMDLNDKDLTQILRDLPKAFGKSDKFPDKIESLQAILQEWEKRNFYPAPTLVEKIQHVFGEMKAEISTVGKYKPERHHVYKGVFRDREPTTLQLEIPGLESEDSLAKIDREIAENTDPLALKVFHAVLSECHRQHEDWGAYCYWDMNTFCDLLGYTREKSGYHQTKNVKQVEKRLKMLAELKYRFEYKNKNSDKMLVFEGPLLTIDPRTTVSLFIGSQRIAKKSALRVHDELHRYMVKQKRFAWFDRRFLKLNSWQDSRAILLYCYYVSQIAMGAKQRKPNHIFKRSIETTLRETGIVIDYHHKTRDRESFIKAHRELQKRGLIEGFGIDWLNNQIQIIFSKDHPSIQKLQAKTIFEANPKLKLPE